MPAFMRMISNFLLLLPLSTSSSRLSAASGCTLLPHICLPRSCQTLDLSCTVSCTNTSNRLGGYWDACRLTRGECKQLHTQTFELDKARMWHMTCIQAVEGHLGPWYWTSFSTMHISLMANAQCVVTLDCCSAIPIAPEDRQRYAIKSGAVLSGVSGYEVSNTRATLLLSTNPSVQGIVTSLTASAYLEFLDISASNNWTGTDRRRICRRELAVVLSEQAHFVSSSTLMPPSHLAL